MEGTPKKNAGLNRRKFFKFGAAALGMSAVGADLLATRNPHQIGEKSSSKEERAKSINTIEGTHATYRIEYTSHDKMSSPDTLTGADALVLELVGSYASEEEVVGIINSIGFDRGAAWNPYIEIVQRALLDKKPIYFVDRSYAKPGEKPLLTGVARSKATGFIETAAGTLLSLSVDAEPKEDTSPVTDLVNASKIAGSGYLLTPAAQEIASRLADDFGSTTPHEGSLPRVAEKQLGAINEVIHPELQTEAVNTRNGLIAEKTELIGKLLEKQLGRKPVIAMEIGAAHFGIENELVRPQDQRIEALRKDLGDFLPLENTIARVQRGERGNLQIDIMQDPSLR